MPEVLEEWDRGEPAYAGVDQKMEVKRLAGMMEMLPRNGTNWYVLYSDIVGNWGRLKGLRNRERIWGDVELIVGQIKKLREEGKIVDWL